ncbi:hypothetical protein [Pseudaminobacter soli (ex Li et al. 2025)]|uniref:Uncharacterized protein n=1 Tax=Pseudaminobacter soli (ex Li et al. 2025) TaxID=1295366 RepID=A0A2P7RZU9_9HYPH|nr:hypothetical protein [Mesorhizobium soli]PSJ55749.1 hypothetical protein C7I85_26015 [Mesorhizobium soli]
MKGYIIAGAAVAAVLLLTFTHWQAYRTGRSIEQVKFIQKINLENTNAGNAAEKWRGDLRRCNDASGLFDFATGSCDR